MRSAPSAVAMPLHRLLLLFAFTLGPGGCTKARVLVQAGAGHLDLITRAQPIHDLITDEDTPQRLRELLIEVVPIKTFGEERGLAPTRSYLSYAQLDRPAAVWMVTASRPLAFEPKTWTFPVIGSVPYIGWFDQMEALSFAADIEAEGWDVAVRRAAAYSTLGWTADPLLSTMLNRGPDVVGDLVNNVLHESVHATVYVSDQSVFNESVATYVADELTLEYLRERFGEGSAELRAYETSEAEVQRRRQRMLAAYEELNALYKSDLAREEKLAKKGEIIDALEADIGRRRPMNNAALLDLRLYRVGGDDVRRLREACGGDWKRLLNTLRQVRPKAFQSPHQEELSPVLDELAKSACGGATAGAAAGGDSPGAPAPGRL